MALYAPAGIECDVTYSVGNFYKSLPEPQYKYDIDPQAPGVIQACASNVPLPDNSISSLMFDPPFVASWNINSKSYKMTERFSNIKGMDNLLEMYKKSIIEAGRIIKKKGILIVKCQDTVYSNKQYFIHCIVKEYAEAAGFYTKDLFILLAKNRITNPGRQLHARKFHSYFWVFKKL